MKDTILKNKNEKINIANSIIENYKCFLFFAIAIYLISYENYVWGLYSFNIVTLLSYWSHYLSHTTTNFFTIIHHYHHENDNFFSYYSEIFLEIFIIGIFIPLQYVLNINIVNYWIALFVVFLYSSLHNYNYSILKVNNVHKLHHTNVETNYGPDLLDIMFGTKHPLESKVENIEHYRMNILLSTIVVLIIKKYIKIDALIIVFVFLFVFLFITSTSLWLDFTRENNKKWYDGII